MRLLHTTKLTFEEFFESEVPPYAILSHRWISGQEISYEDFLLRRKLDATGWKKIRWLAEVARDEYRLEWCWVDTCCIDKRSSAELSEAINSMYKWYKRSQICIAFLSDVDISSGGDASLEQSQWFRRGWTLQELLAPKEVVFYQGNGSIIGTRRNLKEGIATITGIHPSILEIFEPTGLASVAERMSWASQRETTRVEDTAYCLLGIFDVNMPLLYGEGEKAFIRLQQEIINQSDDESIFAWTLEPSPYWNNKYLRGASMLADSPKCFTNSKSVRKANHDFLGEPDVRPPYSVTNKGLDIQVQSPMNFVHQCGHLKAFALLQLECYWEVSEEDTLVRRWIGQPMNGLGHWIFILISHEHTSEWTRVALPFHIRGSRSQLLQCESIRVKQSSYRMPWLLENIGNANETGVMDIGSKINLSLIDFGLVAKNDHVNLASRRIWDSDDDSQETQQMFSY